MFSGAGSAKPVRPESIKNKVRNLLSPFRLLLPEFSLPQVSKTPWLKHLRLIPFDVLTILFIGQIMLPIWAAILLVLVNVGTWWCYHRIPQFLRTVSGPQGDGIFIQGSIVEEFAQFIHSCGVHHRAHYGLMFAMMAGFHTQMTGQLFGYSVPATGAAFLAWGSFSALFLVDFVMYWVSLKTLQELRQDKLRERDEYTEELRRSNAELEQFAYIASHDLRAPLRAILNLCTWIKQDLAPTASKETRHHLDLLLSRTNRMDNLLNDLLQYARIGREDSETETIELNALAQEIFDSQINDDRFALRLEAEPRLIVDYRITYFMLLSNLIGNALKHNDSDRGHVWVSFTHDKNELKITVEDDGPGIDEQFRKRVFEVFTTLSRRDEKEATGMGLAIVQKIAHHKKGNVTVDESPHGGARFVVTLPNIKSGN
ncbi:MAG: hypothetical protein CMK09_13175 [Ponticaulis sp.]|nr:hypothetical protein [Ponticaulis sp.]|tara:strand:+ start:7755 stop:9038 length:1284 start_codon:yes stop_codon:yes gene_type:complete